MLFAPEIKATLFIVVSITGSIQSVDVETKTIDFYNLDKCEIEASKLNDVRYKTSEVLAKGLGEVVIFAKCMDVE